jgi:hypothetical protein
MRLRLTHVLVMMVVIQLAGVLSVRGLEENVGATAVGGVVVIEAPDLDVRDLEKLAESHAGGLLASTPARPTALSPFDPSWVDRLADLGDATALFSTRPREDLEGLRDAWRVIIPAVGDDEDPLDTTQRVVNLMRSMRSARPFLIGVLTEDLDPAELAEMLGVLVETAEELPSYRRTSLVVLGRQMPANGRRFVLRYDVRLWGSRPPPELLDLVDTRR